MTEIFGKIASFVILKDPNKIAPKGARDIHFVVEKSMVDIWTTFELNKFTNFENVDPKLL